jgi:hypothetical protein
MDADRSRESMTDAGVDRDIQALLAVDPSPEFVARVRTRIATEPQRSRWFAGWPVAAAAAVAAAIVAAVFARPRPADVPNVLMTKRLPNAATTIAAAPDAGRSTLDLARRDPDAGRRAQGRPSIAATAVESAVLIDPRESAALRALMTGVRDGRVDLEPVLRAATPAAMDLPPVTAIAIEPITIDPLEGVRP